MGYNHANWGAGEWLAMSVMMLLFTGLLVGLVVWVVRSLRREDHGTRTPGGIGSADDVLAERYARGDIDEDEFHRRREGLRSSTASRNKPGA
ncbi:MAG: SHOCT domain-containing protein [Actinomycetota bacterium]|nr:SHOCT domain-containing protein [Actinomycetota bacterium]